MPKIGPQFTNISDFAQLTFFVLDSLKRRHPEFSRNELHYHMTSFIGICRYLAIHFDKFDGGDYAVWGSEKVGGLIGNHVVHPVHQHYTTHDPCRTEKD